MGLSRTVSKIKYASAEGFPLELGTGRWSQKLELATGPRKNFDGIFSRLQADGRMDTGRQHRPSTWSIASRGKK